MFFVYDHALTRHSSVENTHRPCAPTPQDPVQDGASLCASASALNVRLQALRDVTNNRSKYNNVPLGKGSSSNNVGMKSDFPSLHQV